MPPESPAVNLDLLEKKWDPSKFSTYRHMNSIVGDNDNLDTRKHCGYEMPGVLRRQGSVEKRNCAYIGVTVDRPCAGDRETERFLSPKQPHDPEVMRSTVREQRFLPMNNAEIVDVRRTAL